MITPRDSKTQRAQILAVLLRARGSWVGLPELTKIAAQYGARIHELRRQGFKIINRTETRNGVKHSSFRLALSAAGTNQTLVEKNLLSEVTSEEFTQPKLLEVDNGTSPWLALEMGVRQ